MELRFNLDGNAAPLIGWLTTFAKIRNSLLLEIDPVNKAFVAKTFDSEQTNARYSSIKFEECFVAMPDGFDGDYRIKLGLANRVNTLISLIEAVAASTDDLGNSHFSMTLIYEPIEINKDDGTTIWQSVKDVRFKNAQMSMHMLGSRVTDFIYLSDDLFFDAVYHVDEPVSFTITSDEIKTIMDTAKIYAQDAKEGEDDCLNFVVADGSVCVENIVEDAPADFTIKLCDIEDTAVKLQVPVDRSNFSDTIGKIKGTFELSLGFGNDIPRVLMKALNSDTYIVVAGQMDGGSE